MGIFIYFYVSAAGSPDTPIVVPGSEFEVCTGVVNQPSCYSGSSPTPTLNWSFTSSSGASSQVAYWVMIDDNGDDNGNYPSPEVNTGEVSSSNNFHTVNPGQLQFNTTYYWKVAVKDNYGSWSGWTCADATFTTSPPCNNPPSATNLSTNASSLNYCDKSPVNIILNWQFSDPDPGDSQSAYQVSVTRLSDGASYDSGIKSSSATSLTALTINSEMGYNFIWYDSSGQGYNWRVRVEDSAGAWSAWSALDNFNTPPHAYPNVDFNYAPENPFVNETVYFTDNSTAYGGAIINSWLWDFGPNANPSTSTNQNATTTFTSLGNQTVTLTVTDSDGFSCSQQKIIGAVWSPLRWEEIIPWPFW